MNLTKEQKIKLYTNMVRARKVDELMVKGVQSGKVPSFYHSGQGQEAIGVGACSFLREDDYLVAYHRGHGLCELISKGLPVNDYVAEHYGKATGSCNGVAGHHCCDMQRGIFGRGGTVGGHFTLAAGAGLTAKLRGKGQVVVCLFGDGSTGRGTFHTALLMSANWKLPVVWLCSNNRIAQFVPIEVSYPKENIADLAYGYDIPAKIVDGQDVVAVYEAVQEAVDKARAGEGPSFIECKTYRFRAHVEGSADLVQTELRSEEEINVWKKRDPIDLFGKKLLVEGILSQDDIAQIEREAVKETEEADSFSTESPVPHPEILQKVLYAD